MSRVSTQYKRWSIYKGKILIEVREPLRSRCKPIVTVDDGQLIYNTVGTFFFLSILSG